jgi:hypothetical protein
MSLTLMSQLCITILNFEGCIVRGQWRSMESAASNSNQGHGNA